MLLLKHHLPQGDTFAFITHCFVYELPLFPGFQDRAWFKLAPVGIIVSLIVITVLLALEIHEGNSEGWTVDLAVLLDVAVQDVALLQR